jgi:ankyrin repeat protein
MLGNCRGHENIVAYLIDKDAELHTVKKNGLTSLMIAAGRGQFETVKILMKQGAVDVQARSNRGWATLMVAVAKRGC